MAKHTILESYTFNPSTRTIVVNGKNIRREQLLLITNVTRNTVIYNFSDPNLTATSYTNGTSTTGIAGGILETTTIILNYNTSSMSSSDVLNILVEETYQEIIPAEVLMDPVGKMRVSEPQSLIDTDFEYGTQPTKWETITLMSNRPSAFFYPSTGSIPISNVTGSYQGNNSVLVATTDTVTTGLAVGTPIYVQGSTDASNVDGWWTIETLNANSSFTYRTTGIPTWAAWDPPKTIVYVSQYYSNAAIAVNNVFVQSNIIYVSTTNAHNLLPGNGIWLNGTTGVAKLDGPWTVATIPTSNTFTANGYEFANAGPTVSALAAQGKGGQTSFLSNVLYMRPASYTAHRAFDGGVQFTVQNQSHGAQVIRQTRRYFRYQSGKGIQFSTGSILKPKIEIDSLTSIGTVVTVNTRQPHGINPGTNILVSGAVESAYNGYFLANTTLNPVQFTYNALTSPTNSTATGFPITVSPNSWYGSKSRVGMFDTQNGFFFELDGQTIYVVKRSSTAQISGLVTITQGSPTVIGLNTQFGRQLIPGDYVVIRGMSYLVSAIQNDTNMTISPEYRGISAARCLVSKTIDTKIPQSQWNIDTCDGLGASRFALDLSKMQMFYVDYSWYGAGTIRWGFKNNRGEVMYCHRLTNNNINTEAYMRSGNMCARYETNTLPPYTVLTGSITTGSSTFSVVDASLFPPSGTVMVANTSAFGGFGTGGVQNAPIEFINYSSKTANTFTISARGVYGGVASANTFTYQANVPIAVSLVAPQNAVTISHWGSSVIMDGRYDDDKSLVFTIGQNNTITNLPINQRYAIISLRISPSVDNGIAGLLGVREVVNRMQLILRQMDVLTTGPFRMDVILNGTPASGFWSSIGGSSLSQYSLHANATPVVGGENIFSFFTNTGGVTQQDMTLVSALGTSILGGGQSALANVAFGRYPDGPDVITICATPLQLSSNINARVSWTEAQA
jgi:hypothetical protein